MQPRGSRNARREVYKRPGSTETAIGIEKRRKNPPVPPIPDRK